MRPFVIFGASSGGIKVHKMLRSIGLLCEYFVDNSEAKWETLLEDRMVKKPACLQETDYNIVIASVYQEQIEEQLLLLKIDLSRIITREQLVHDFFETNILKYQLLLNNRSVTKKEKQLILDLDHGLITGGIESWSYLLTETALKNGVHAIIYTNGVQENLPKIIKDHVKHMDLSRIDFEKEVLEVAEDMLQYLPMLFISNWYEHSFWAAYILKKLYPNQVSIIGMVHHDALCYYRRNQYVDSLVDKFLCVSDDTQKKMVNNYHISEEKVKYKEVAIEENIFKRVHVQKRDVVIGMASRMDKAMKRVDLLIPLIEYLEELKVSYTLLIAGAGSYFSKIQEYLIVEKLQHKIRMLGEIEREKMSEFWKNCDIVISTSDSEGIGLSILEAMSFGCVPVVTDTAGIRCFIKNNENGYIVPVGDIKKMSAKIQFLSENSDIRNQCSELARSTIVEKCNPLKYLDFIKKMI